jgi:hypothetical protein
MIVALGQNNGNDGATWGSDAVLAVVALVIFAGIWWFVRRSKQRQPKP